MEKKFLGKMKSFKELLCMADDIDENGTLWFKGNLPQQMVGFRQDFKFLCGKEIKILNYNKMGYDYIYEIPIYFLKEWFSEIKEVEDNGVWKPNGKENVYFIDSFGRIGYTPNSGDVKNDYNKFKTQEEATIIKRDLTLYMAMKRWSFDNDNGYEFVEGKDNWEIYFDMNSKDFIVDNRVFVKELFGVYFSSKEKAEQCFKWLKKEGLK